MKMINVIVLVGLFSSCISAAAPGGAPAELRPCLFTEDQKGQLVVIQPVTKEAYPIIAAMLNELHAKDFESQALFSARIAEEEILFNARHEGFIARVAYVEGKMVGYTSAMPAAPTAGALYKDEFYLRVLAFPKAGSDADERIGRLLIRQLFEELPAVTSFMAFKHKGNAKASLFYSFVGGQAYGVNCNEMGPHVTKVLNFEHYNAELLQKDRFFMFLKRPFWPY